MNGAIRSADHLVVGGGLAGAMAGLRLARAGLKVTLLERERGPHNTVCGEFLSREAVEYLEQAGVYPLELGAKTLRVVSLSAGGRSVESELPFTALSLSRRVLDDTLLFQAKRAMCHVEHCAWVERLEAHGGGWRAHLRDGNCHEAATVFLASGKHDMRGQERPAGRHGNLVGFKLHFKLTKLQTSALQDRMELFLFSGGYGGLSLIEAGAANFCLVVKKAVLRSRGGWPGLFAAICAENPHLALRLDGSTPLWDKPLAVSSIPYGHLGGPLDGLWRVGDQVACIPSFTGDGMSIALHTGALAAQMAIAGESVESYHRRVRQDLSGSMRLATTLSRAMVTGVGRRLAPVGLSIFPQAMDWIAACTRIPQRALERTLGTALPQREIEAR